MATIVHVNLKEAMFFIVAETRRKEVSRVLYGPPLPKRRRGTTLEFAAHVFREEFIEFIEDFAEYRRYCRAEPNDEFGRPRGTEGFDIGFIRWMFEGRWGQLHPEDDWDHPAWSHPLGVASAYDAD
ncbi:uncharacterized protein [Venturia canescens]|uniref:uncharacterized protein n=1 Tax=Venturia canescens TaxID=32260 RepID=UPI001C9C1699|nr:uncharacterized protein LOC122409511 [Venturia canescens]